MKGPIAKSRFCGRLIHPPSAGLLISVVSAYDLSKPVKLMRTELSEMDMKAQQMFDIIDVNHDGILTKDEVVDAHKLLNLTPEAAADLFDKLDVSNDGKIERKEKLKPSFFNTVPGKCVWLVFKMYVVIFIGAAFMKWDGDESAAQALTWVDAMYFATTTVMSVGYVSQPLILVLTACCDLTPAAPSFSNQVW